LTGWVADRWGGARHLLGVRRDGAGRARRALLPRRPRAARALCRASSPCFLLLFFASGVGNASTFQMIPAIMRKDMERLMPGASAEPSAVRQGIGGDHRLHLGDRRLRRLLHPKSFGTSIAMTGGASPRSGLPDLLRHLHRHHLVLLHPPGGLLFDVERGARPDARTRIRNPRRASSCRISSTA
jgi:NNP family nitrate/nitrite transporter-like MFS transporter